MKGEYQIDVDVPRSLVRIGLTGFFDDTTMRGFIAARKLAFRRLTCGPNEHLSLTDIRGMAIQSQEMVARWSAVMADPTYRSRRLAFVVASTLARTQLQRAIGSRDACCFTGMTEAEAWVLSADKDRRAA